MLANWFLKMRRGAAGALPALLLALLLGLTLNMGMGGQAPAVAAEASPAAEAASSAAPAPLSQDLLLLRRQYVEEVQFLAGKAETMRLAGSSQEDIARTLHADRRALGVKYKNLTPAPKLEEIYQRNLKKYGDKLGPTVEWLRERGKSWDDIINSASRTGGKDLGL